MKRMPALMQQFLIIYGIILLTSCTTSSTYFSQRDNDCEILAEKRNKQPSARQIRKFNRKTFVFKQEHVNEPSQQNISLNTKSVFYQTEAFTLTEPNVDTAYTIQASEGQFYPELTNQIEHGEEQASKPLIKAEEQIEKEIRSGNSNDNQQQSNSYWFAFLAVPAVTSVLLISMFPAAFIRFSAWAAHHPYLGRTLIGASQTVAALGAVWLGNDLSSHGITLPPAVLASAAGALLVTSFTYPKHSSVLSSFTQHYVWRKFHDVVLFTSASAMVLYAANTKTFAFQQLNQGVVFSEQVQPKETPQFVKSDNGDQKLVKASQDKPKKPLKGLKVFFAILGFTALTLVIGGAACAIACAGNEGLALAFFVFGEGGLIFGFARLLRRIYRGKPNKDKVPTEPSPVTE